METSPVFKDKNYKKPSLQSHYKLNIGRKVLYDITTIEFIVKNNIITLILLKVNVGREFDLALACRRHQEHLFYI